MRIQSMAFLIRGGIITLQDGLGIGNMRTRHRLNAHRDSTNIETYNKNQVIGSHSTKLRLMRGYLRLTGLERVGKCMALRLALLLARKALIQPRTFPTPMRSLHKPYISTKWIGVMVESLDPPLSKHDV